MHNENDRFDQTPEMIGNDQDQTPENSFYISQFNKLVKIDYCTNYNNVVYKF